MAIFGNIDMSATSTASTHTFTTDQNIIIGALICNTHTDSVKVDVTLRGKYLVKGVALPVGTSLSILDGKLVANNTDQLSVQTDVGTADVVFSVLNEAV